MGPRKTIRAIANLASCQCLKHSCPSYASQGSLAYKQSAGKVNA